MKRVLVILSVIAVMMSVTGCESGKVRALKRDIEAADRDCPVSMGMMGDIINFIYDEQAREVQIVILWSQDVMDLTAFDDNESLVHQSMKLAFSKGEYRDLIKKMIAAESRLTLVFKNASTGKNVDIKLTLDDLKEIQNTEMTDRDRNKLLLESQVEMANSMCPYNVDEGLEMIKVVDDGENIVYVCRIDEEFYDMEVLRSSQDEIKHNMIEFLNDPGMKKMMEIIMSQNRGLVYQYVADSGAENVDIVFKPQELRRYVR